MKVNKGSVSSTYATAGKAYGKVKKASDPQPVRESDSVEMSESGSLFQAALTAVKDVPDIRTEAVAPIQKEMDDGSYHRDEHEVAEKIVQDHVNTPSP